MNAEGLKLVDGVFVDAVTGKQVRFEPVLIRGRGWTVGRVTGSRRKGRTVRVEPGFEGCAYTLHQAQAAAGVLTGYVWHTLRVK